MHKAGEENRKAIKGYQNYIYQFCYKRNVVVEPLKVAHGARFQYHRFRSWIVVKTSCDMEGISVCGKLCLPIWKLLI
jgi:hypothetical protein